MIATEAGYAIPALFITCVAALAAAFASMREARWLGSPTVRRARRWSA